MNRPTFRFSALGLPLAVAGAIGAAAYGVASTTGPMAGDGHRIVGAITLPTVIVAGFLDGLNPCAFAVLLVFVASIFAMVERQAAVVPSPVRARRAILRLGSVYISGMFLVYLALGVGLLGAASFFSRTHVVSRFAAVVALFLGLLLLKEALIPETGTLLRIPAGLHATVRRLAEKTTMPGMFGAGVVVGLCAVPCSGAVYLAVIALLAAQTTRAAGYAYLVLYNLAFILPLAAVLVGASSRPVLNQLGRWQLHHRTWLKAGLGALSILLGLAILLIV